MKTLLTGGAGYVGSACLRWLLDRGHEAIAFDNLSAGNESAVPKERLFVGDLVDRSSLQIEAAPQLPKRRSSQAS